MTRVADEDLVAAFEAYMAAHPYTTRSKVATALNTSIPRLLSLGCAVPRAVSPSAAAKMARKASPWGSNFRLKGSTPHE